MMTGAKGAWTEARRGYCVCSTPSSHLTKSSRTAPGLAALNADMREESAASLCMSL